MTEQQAVEASQLRQDFHNATLRMDVLIYLPAAISGGIAGEALEKFVEYDLADEVETNGLLFPGVEGLSEDELRGDWEANVDYIASRHSEVGFLAELARPVFTRGSYSWGHYNTRWFYGETIEEIMKQAITWADALDAKNKAKAK